MLTITAKYHDLVSNDVVFVLAKHLQKSCVQQQGTLHAGRQ